VAAGHTRHDRSRSVTRAFPLNETRDGPVYPRLRDAAGKQSVNRPLRAYPARAWVSVLYVVFRRLLEFVVLLGRDDRTKELEILVLRHELSILRRQARRQRFEAHDRILLAAFSRMLPRHSWTAFSVRPETLLA
jgi:hypothetical protein